MQGGYLLYVGGGSINEEFGEAKVLIEMCSTIAIKNYTRES